MPFLVGLAFLVVAIGLKFLATRSPESVENTYSNSIYPIIATIIGAFTGSVPFSFAEVLAMLVASVVVFRLVRGLYRLIRSPTTIKTALGAFFTMLSLWGGSLYLIFVLIWGLNYQRETFAEISGLEVRPAGPGELEALAGSLALQCNTLRGGLSEDPAGVMRLGRPIKKALQRTPLGFERVGVTYPELSRTRPPPKVATGSFLLSTLGLTGIFIPFTFEPLVNADYPAPGIPFVACHEFAHSHGFAREDEANFLAALGCRLHPDPEFRYSGALLSLRHVLSVLADTDEQAYDRINAGLSEAVQRDIESFHQFWERYRSKLWDISQAVNDQYLKSQGEELGVESYGRMVDLLLAEFRRGM